MPASHTELYVHLVWATWDRLPLLSPDAQAAAFTSIRSECGSLAVELLAVGGVADHVHALVRMPATLSVSALVKQLKGASSRRLNQRHRRESPFRWQGGYAAFAVSRWDVLRIRGYVLSQARRHAEGATRMDLELPTDG